MMINVRLHFSHLNKMTMIEIKWLVFSKKIAESFLYGRLLVYDLKV